MVTAEAPRFDPILLTSEDLEDLSTFFGMSQEACFARLREYTPLELAARWKSADPKTSEQIVDFYREAEQYVWELMQWHTSTARAWARTTLSHLVQHYPASAGFGRVLDFGCGIGTDSLFLVGHGYRTTLVDVAGPAFSFAQHRFRRRGIQAEFIEARGPLPEISGKYDIIVCFDVFEHLPDPFRAARALVDSLRPGGLLVQSACFEDDGTYPCHLHGNIHRFEGIRWHIHLAGLGLRHRVHLLYERLQGLPRMVQLARYTMWRASGLWIPAPHWTRHSRDEVRA